MYRVLEKKRKIRRKWINFLRSNDGKKVSSIRVLPIYYIRLETRAECTNAVHVCQGRHKSIYPRIGGIYMRIGSDTKPDEWWLAKGNDPSRGYLFSPPPPFSRFFLFLRITFDRLSRFYSPPHRFFPQFQVSLYRCLSKSFSPNDMMYKRVHPRKDIPQIN